MIVEPNARLPDVIMDWQIEAAPVLFAGEWLVEVSLLSKYHQQKLIQLLNNFSFLIFL